MSFHSRSSRFLTPVVLLFGSLSGIGTALAHPGHPGHEDDPYQKTGDFLTAAGGWGFALPLAALGLVLALTSGRTRGFLAVAVLMLLAGTALQHGPDWWPALGMLIAGTLHLTTGFILGKGWRFLQTAADPGERKPRV